MNDYISQLNPAQREAVLHGDGPLLIFAGAGSGKTRVLTYRIARLIQEGVDPYNIIAITFTNKAAKEMRERIAHIAPMGDQVWVSTFHAACTRILRRDITALGYRSGFSIYDAQDSERLLKLCIKEENLDDKSYPPKGIAGTISAQKNALISPEEFERKAGAEFRLGNIANIYTRYQQKLRENNALDFDDIIMLTVQLLSQDESIRERYQRRFRYVLVDEYQDTNHAQYALVNLLAGMHKNLCVVGDDDQSIYGWRGADIENILRFTSDYPGATSIMLEQNYRSTQMILDAANLVISGNENRASKKLWTENKAGVPLRIYSARDERDEGAFVCNAITYAHERGANYNDFAVLYRGNAQSRAVEEQLIMAGIPYRLFGGVRFYERMEVKDILAYLKAIDNPADDMACRRIINVPRRGIGETTITRVANHAAENGLSLSAALGADIQGINKKTKEKLTEFSLLLNEWTSLAGTLPVSQLLKQILADTDYFAALNDGTPEAQTRIENVHELLAKAQEFEAQSQEATLTNFLNEVGLVADIDNYQEAAQAVSLMTLHSAKGLEFNRVFIVGLEEYTFPSARSMLSETPTELEEERRLCYVGFTRARQRLYLSHASMRMRNGQRMMCVPSRFLKEVPPTHKEHVNAHGRPKGYKPSIAATAEGGNAPTPRKPSFLAEMHTPIAAPSAPFSIGDKVRDPRLGAGVVIAVTANGADHELTIDFPNIGRKKRLVKLFNIVKI
ncbi:MAG: UvrD-helicase domain-containing protein [Defluviitaleaceae bacterium]|nr:UvrD-helicase domain-containing protein [Defluviitaleaceae bacterium]MCL2275375.1 UvrD-helicase domain-containing protein [Defluviitaleaceae bacterium]